jgi:hypothetical protein
MIPPMTRLSIAFSVACVFIYLECTDGNVSNVHHAIREIMIALSFLIAVISHNQKTKEDILEAIKDAAGNKSSPQ